MMTSTRLGEQVRDGVEEEEEQDEEQQEEEKDEEQEEEEEEINCSIKMPPVPRLIVHSCPNLPESLKACDDEYNCFSLKIPLSTFWYLLFHEQQTRAVFS